jgi:hypothetical protein
MVIIGLINPNGQVTSRTQRMLITSIHSVSNPLSSSIAIITTRPNTMSAPIDDIPPASSATRAHATNVTAPTDSYGIAQKPVPERADPQQGESFHFLAEVKLMVAATGPGSGSVDTSNAVPFKEQVCHPTQARIS